MMTGKGMKIQLVKNYEMNNFLQYPKHEKIHER